MYNTVAHGFAAFTGWMSYHVDGEVLSNGSTTLITLLFLSLYRHIGRLSKEGTCVLTDMLCMLNIQPNYLLIFTSIYVCYWHPSYKFDSPGGFLFYCNCD